MSGLFLNFFECKLSKYSISCRFFPYETSSKYKNLREDNSDHFFSRYGDKIYCWPLSEGLENPSGSRQVRVHASENPLLFNKVLEMAFITFLKSKETHNLYYHRYSHTWKIISRKYLFDTRIEGLDIFRQVNLNPYFFQPNDKKIFGIVLSTTVQNRFSWTRKQFERNGVDVSGLKGKDDIIFANRQSLKRFLSARGAEELYDQKLEEFNSRYEQFNVIRRFYNWLRNHLSEMFLPDEIKINSLSMKYLPYQNNFVKSEILSKPARYYFGGKTSDQERLYYNQQVKKYKPYSYELFENQPVTIGILCPKEYEGITEGFINRLEGKLKHDLHVRHVTFKFCFIENTKLTAYKEHLYDSGLLASNLIIVIVNEEQEKLPPNLSPYYVCKAKYIGNGIPTQDIQAKNLKDYNQFILNNVALNIYAKLGGTAWTIEKEEKRREELVIGIGSTSDKDGKHVLGIAQIFHSDGRYLVGDCAPLSTYENYVENLTNYLHSTLNTVINDHIDTTSEFRLIIHLFKSASNRYEIKAIERAIQNFDHLSFKYALVHLAYGHNFRLFYNDGRANVRRGTYLKLDSHAALLHFVPESDLPLYIQLDRRSTFTDLYYISKQIFWFSNLSHRSYFPAKKTVTISYPSFMAQLTEKLKSVEGWDYDRLNNVSDKLWFI